MQYMQDIMTLEITQCTSTNVQENGVVISICDACFIILLLVIVW